MARYNEREELLRIAEAHAKSAVAWARELTNLIRKRKTVPGRIWRAAIDYAAAVLKMTVTWAVNEVRQAEQ